MTRRILLIGGTGLVGELVIERLTGRTDVVPISLVRRTRRNCERVVDFEALVARPRATIAALAPDGVDAAVSCLGTTLRRAGSKEAQWRVDHDYVAAFAAGAHAAGARQFVLTSAAGAGGRGFYLETKGAVERAVCAIGFARVDLVRPGLLLGERAEHRPGERLAQMVMPVLRPLLVGPLSRWGAIPATTVADAVVRLLGETTPGVHVHHDEALERLAA